VNTKKVREFSGLTQEQIACALDLTLNGWQRKEQNNTSIKIELKVTEKIMAKLLRVANVNKKSVSELIGEMIESKGTNSKKINEKI